MAVAVELLRRGRRVGVDMEDWFSEDLLPGARRRRPINLLRQFEKELLARGRYASCPSTSMSKSLADAYGIDLPTVIYNSFPWTDRLQLDNMKKDRRNLQILSIHWYSQTIGPGRGLEDLLAALPVLKHDVEIHLRGRPVEGLETWLGTQVSESWRRKIFLHDLVPNDELLSRIAEHDIGFAGEMKYCNNKDLTISNKILQYLLAGLAVVASDTAGQQEVAREASNAIVLYPSQDYFSLGVCINELLGSREYLHSMKAGALRAAKDIFCWERQEPILLEAVIKALNGRT
jgi:glycosyltransferase involved in cell wall biosynthesis